MGGEYWGTWHWTFNAKRYNVKSIAVVHSRMSGGNFAVYGSKAGSTYGYFFDENSDLQLQGKDITFMYAGHFPKALPSGAANRLEEGAPCFRHGAKDVASLSASASGLTFNSETPTFP